MYKQIVIDRNYKVYRDSKSKRLIMSVDGKPTLSANYYYDKPGRCVLISKFEFFDNNHAKLDLFALLDILHKYIATNRYAKKAGCRFMCMVNKEFSNVLLAFEFHSKQAPYLMVRTNKSQPIGDNPRIDTDNIVVINNKTDLINLKTTLTKILSGNAYWLNNADENEVVHRIKKAEHAFAIALKGQDETNVIGFVRVIDDGLLQYISDVVIAGEFQNKGYGKYLFKIINDKVLSESKIGLLVRAHEGPGLLPAKMVYEKFGFFESNDTNQQIGNEVIGYKVVHNSTQHPQRLKP
jgi:GNAT superfamily N-acetyltransferase